MINRIFRQVSFRQGKARRGQLSLIFLLLCTLILAACSDEPTAAPANAPVTNGAGNTPAATSGTGSGIVAQAPASGQPLPTPTPPGPDVRRVLTIWTGGWKGNADYEKFLNEQIDNYRVRNRNMTVDWQDYGGDLAAKFQEASANPTKNPPPDIVLFNEGDLYQFGGLGRLADLTTLGGSGLKDDYVPATFEALRFGSVYYGLPWVASTRVTIINKRLWQQATLDPAKPPRTYADLEPMLPLMVSKTAKDVTPVWVKPDPLVDFMMEDTPLFNPSGDGKSQQTAFPSEQSVAKWQYYQDKSRRLVFDKDGLTKGYSDALKKYAAGQLVMVLDGAPLLPALKNTSVDLYNNTLVVPHMVGRANILPLDIQGWAISKASKQPGEALQFLKFLNTPENQLAFAKFSGLTVPSLKKALNDPYVTSQDEPLAQARSIMAATLDRTRPPEQLLPAPLTPTERDQLLSALYTAQGAIWAKDTPTPQAALTEAAKVWTEVLNKRATK